SRPTADRGRAARRGAQARLERRLNQRTPMAVRGTRRGVMATVQAAYGTSDLGRRVDALAERLPDELKPLAAVAYNYPWSWHPHGANRFRDMSAHRWAMSGHNPVRFLRDLWPDTQRMCAANPSIVERIATLVADVEADLARPENPRPGIDGPIAF